MAPAPEGVIFQVQRWSLHDGAGIRSTVFLKGCPLRCAWCANPESWSGRIENGFGERLTVDDLMGRLRRDEVFYRESGGGVTFSGGEPLFQADFTLAAARAARQCGYHTAIETSLKAPWEKAWPILELMDEVFMDLKIMDPARHHKFTGADNALILANGEKLLNNHPGVTVRVPLVAGVNDDQANALALADFARRAAHRPSIEFMPYHNLGQSKYRRLNLPAPDDFQTPTAEVLADLKSLLEKHGLNVL